MSLITKVRLSDNHIFNLYLIDIVISFAFNMF